MDTKQDTHLSSPRLLPELAGFLLFLLGPAMFKSAESPRLERSKSPQELGTPLKPQPGLGKHSK